MTDLAVTRSAARAALPALIAGTVVALAWRSPAFCGEIHDAARLGDLVKVKALLKANPDLAFSRRRGECH